MVGIELPGEDRLPPGPARDLAVALHELYRRAGRPGLRRISKAITYGNFRDTVSHEAVSDMLNGKGVPRWSKLECVVRQLADWNSPRLDPDQTASLFLPLWEAVIGGVLGHQPSPVISGIAGTPLLPPVRSLPAQDVSPLRSVQGTEDTSSTVTWPLRPGHALITSPLLWRAPNDDHETAQVRHLRDNRSSHPTFIRLSEQPNTPFTVRVGVSLHCSPLPATQPDTSDVRNSFLEFLGRPPICDLVMTLTPIEHNTRWQKWAGHGRTNHEALVFTQIDQQEEPAAWARILMPEPQNSMASWRDPDSATFLVHVPRRNRTVPMPPPLDLTDLHRLLMLTLDLPSALAHFLRDDLGLSTAGKEPTSAAVWMDSPDALCNYVSIGECQPLPGSPSFPRFESYAVLDHMGVTVSEMAIEWIRQMCDDALHFDNYEPLLSALKH